MFGFTGALLSKVRHMQNGGKRPRHSIDGWDRQSTCSLLLEQRRLTSCEAHISNCYFAVMDRDRRLTGFLRGQTDNPRAPAGFELSNPWRVRLSTPVQGCCVGSVLILSRLNLNTREETMTSAMALSLDLYILYDARTSHTPKALNSLLNPSSSVFWSCENMIRNHPGSSDLIIWPSVRNTLAAIIL